MDKGLTIGLVVGLFAVATALFQSAQNGRYQYTTNGSQAVIVDTRTGDFWTEDGSHFEPRMARVTAHHPTIDDQTESDDSAQKFHDCLLANIQAVRNHSDKRDCLAERHLNFQRPAPTTPAPSQP
jgi:hypothetical protein